MWVRFQDPERERDRSKKTGIGTLSEYIEGWVETFQRKSFPMNNNEVQKKFTLFVVDAGRVLVLEQVKDGDVLTHGVPEAVGVNVIWLGERIQDSAQDLNDFLIWVRPEK